MIRRYKKQLIISSIITLLPTFIGLFMWDLLAENLAVHWSIDGNVNAFNSKGFVILGFPVILLLMNLICIFFTVKDPKNKEQSDKVIKMIFLIVPAISLISNGYVYAFAFGSELNSEIIVRSFIGIVFIVVGNYLPKCKQNHTIGIKVTWTLRNEENWNKTHRFTGRLWVVGGILILATIFVPMEIFIYPLLAIVILFSFIPVIYSYLYYKKQLQLGTASKEDGKMTKYEKSTTKAAIIIGMIIVVGVIFVFCVGKYEVNFGENAFTIEASFWDDVAVKYEDIDDIEFKDKDNPGSRTFGYGTPTLLMGECENEEYGTYTRYTYLKCDACIVITVGEEILVINGKDEKSTREMYDKLLDKINK